MHQITPNPAPSSSSSSSSPLCLLPLPHPSLPRHPSPLLLLRLHVHLFYPSSFNTSPLIKRGENDSGVLLFLACQVSLLQTHMHLCWWVIFTRLIWGQRTSVSAEWKRFESWGLTSSIHPWPLRKRPIKARSDRFGHTHTHSLMQTIMEERTDYSALTTCLSLLW